MAIVAHLYRFIVGVDTHARNHVLSILECATGAEIVCQTFANTSQGHVRAQAWITKHTRAGLGWVCDTRGVRDGCLGVCTGGCGAVSDSYGQRLRLFASEIASDATLSNFQRQLHASYRECFKRFKGRTGSACGVVGGAPCVASSAIESGRA